VAAAGREKRTLLTAGGDAAMARLRRRLAETGLATAVGASAGDIIAFVKAAVAGAPPEGPMALQVPTESAAVRSSRARSSHSPTPTTCRCTSGR